MRHAAVPAHRMCRAIAAWVVLTLQLFAASVLLAASAHAHLMPAQRGTINWVGDGGFMVLSLPVSAFKNIDDDGDGQLSPAELGSHQAAITQQIQNGVQLLDGDTALPLQGILLNLSADDAQTNQPASQLLIMGRYRLPEVYRYTPGSDNAALYALQPLRLRVALWSPQAAEQRLQVNLSRGDEVAEVFLTPTSPTRAVLAPASSVLLDYVVLGAEHITLGLDHLLFLLVILAAVRGWRAVLGVLSCFTVGHAITLTATVFGLIQVSPALVEPAIAATIVGMALLDMVARKRGITIALRWHLALVGGCALIHGLGLAGALAEQGLDQRHLLLSVAGFNVGIELAQVAIAALVLGSLALVTRWAGAQQTVTVTRFASMAGMFCGTWWLVQRLT
jgi:hypothetical protein